MHMETLLKEKKNPSVALWVRIQAAGRSLEVGEQKSPLLFVRYDVGGKYSSAVALRELLKKKSNI